MHALKKQGYGCTGGGFKTQVRIPSVETKFVMVRNFVWQQHTVKKATVVQVTEQLLENGAPEVPVDEFNAHQKKKDSFCGTDIGKETRRGMWR